jgi:AcrR family transcriptional regulator
VSVHSQKASTVPAARGRGRPPTPGRREHLLDVALTLFAERGFHGTTIPDLAAAAGLAQGSIYRHVESKEALVNEVYRQAKGLLAAALFAAVPPTAPLREQFHALWWALVGFARREPRAFAFLELHHHGAYLDAESRAVELRVLAPIAQVVEQGRARGALKPLPAPALIVTVWGAFVGMFKAARAGYFKLDDDICRHVEETAWDAISRAPARLSARANRSKR